MSTKRLRSVVQSIGHHAVSGLCYVHPHLGESCKAATRASAEVDLLAGRVRLDEIDIPKALESGSRALGLKFAEILASENMNPASLRSATIEFQFHRTLWPRSCHVKVETNDGKILEDAVSASGERAEILRGSRPS